MAVTTELRHATGTDDPDELIHRIMATPGGPADPYALYHRLRGAAEGAFIPPTMEALRPRVAAIVAERLDRLAALGEADVMAELAFPMPVTVVGEMVGVPEEDRAWFRPLMRTLVSSDSFNR